MSDSVFSAITLIKSPRRSNLDVPDSGSRLCQRRKFRKRLTRLLSRRGGFFILRVLTFSLSAPYLSLPLSRHPVSMSLMPAMAEARRRKVTDDRCNITDDGKAALLRLSKGDMRRALNVLQVSPYPFFTLWPLPQYPDCHHGTHVL
jgi:hypothetical protein